MDINIQDYTQDRKKENMSVEINSDIETAKLSLSKLVTDKNIILNNDMNSLLIRSVKIDAPNLDKYVKKTSTKKKEEIILPKQKEIDLTNVIEIDDNTSHSQEAACAGCRGHRGLHALVHAQSPAREAPARACPGRAARRFHQRVSRNFTGGGRIRAHVHHRGQCHAGPAGRALSHPARSHPARGRHEGAGADDDLRWRCTADGGA